jgi:hypothetical protein
VGPVVRPGPDGRLAGAVTAIQSGLVDLTVLRGHTDTMSGVWVETSRHVIRRCVGAPGASVEQVPGANGTSDTTVADMVVYAPFGADVVASDRVLLGDYPQPSDGWDAEQYEVQGRPVTWQSPYTGRRAGTVISLNVRQ